MAKRTACGIKCSHSVTKYGTMLTITALLATAWFTMYNSIHRNVAAVIGTLILLRFSLHLISNLCTWIRAYFLAPWGIGRTNLKKYGPWASEVLSSSNLYCKKLQLEYYNTYKSRVDTQKNLFFLSSLSCDWIVRRNWAWLCPRGTLRAMYILVQCVFCSM